MDHKYRVINLQDLEPRPHTQPTPAANLKLPSRLANRAGYNNTVMYYTDTGVN